MFIADAALYLSKAKPALEIKDPYELTERQFAAVVKLLHAQRPLVTSYWTTASDEIELFSSGRSSVGAAWPYQEATLQKAGVKVAVGAPREGTTGWLDSWMLSATAKHPNCAYRWLNWVSSPQLQAEQATFYGATPVNKKACPLMDKLEKSSCAAYRADAAGGVLPLDQVLEDPARRLRGRSRQGVRALCEVGARLGPDRPGDGLPQARACGSHR